MQCMKAKKCIGAGAVSSLGCILAGCQWFEYSWPRECQFLDGSPECGPVSRPGIFGLLDRRCIALQIQDPCGQRRLFSFFSAAGPLVRVQFPLHRRGRVGTRPLPWGLPEARFLGRDAREADAPRERPPVRPRGGRTQPCARCRECRLRPDFSLVPARSTGSYR